MTMCQASHYFPEMLANEVQTMIEDSENSMTISHKL